MLFCCLRALWAALKVLSLLRTRRLLLIASNLALNVSLCLSIFIIRDLRMFIPVLLFSNLLFVDYVCLYGCNWLDLTCLAVFRNFICCVIVLPVSYLWDLVGSCFDNVWSFRGIETSLIEKESFVVYMWEGGCIVS